MQSVQRAAKESQGPQMLPPIRLLLGAEKVLSLFISKWAVRVVYSLGRGPKRHSEIRRELRPISQKVLTSTLRDLETAGLVQHEVIGSKAPYVSRYSLTTMGRSFVQPLRVLCEWAQAHEEELDAAYSRAVADRHGAKQQPPVATAG